MMEGSPTVEFKRAYNRARAHIERRASEAERWIDPYFVKEWKVQEERKALAELAEHYFGVDGEETLRAISRA